MIETGECFLIEGELLMCRAKMGCRHIHMSTTAVQTWQNSMLHAE